MRSPVGLVAALALLLSALSLARGDDERPEVDDAVVVDSSYDAPDGTRVLQQSIVIPAARADVWRALTTAEGWKAMGIPFVSMDFRLGGAVETSYDAKAEAGSPKNIRNRILAYLPLRMLALQAEQAPPGFPAPEVLPHLFSVFELESLGPARTRLTVSGVGYREGEAFEKVRRLFEGGNAWTLRTLRKNLTPTDDATR